MIAMTRTLTLGENSQQALPYRLARTDGRLRPYLRRASLSSLITRLAWTTGMDIRQSPGVHTP